MITPASVAAARWCRGFWVLGPPVVDHRSLAIS
eukprot:CAMPEP_0118992980 /NCGR_PEP_ID=MMETSP1173-20130426/54231_1 /TAXON_ID=1034831 /ORGANISM="Rhizochromulina marina cf, Strain CCMP1243" /LENGTH=32 /DNA_ID= /DNA_START= /DNA_END= /DNA_ORIENTATION=